MRGIYRALRRGGSRGESGFTLVELLVVVVIIGILASVSVPVYLNVRKAAWNSTAEQDVKNAQIAIETASVDMGGKLPASFERKARTAGDPPNERVYALKSFTWGDTSNKEIGSSVTLSPDVALCYTADTTYVDKYGNPTTKGSAARGVSNGMTYRIYATNSNNLDVYYLYDSATGLLTEEDNPDRVPASVGDSEGGYYAAHTGPKGKMTRPYGVITSCDIETYYHLYGK